MNSVIDFIKTFLLYITLPLRILFFIFIVIFCNFVLSFLKDESSIMGVILISCKLFMFILSLNINISKDDLMKYMKYLYSDQKLICTFNHTTFADGFILASALPRSCYVMLKLIFHTLIYYTDANNEKYGNIYVKKGKTSETIKNRVNNRKIGDPIICIAPGSGNTPQIPGNITDFTGTGAFVEGFPILPIVIKYEDDSLHHNHDNGESMLHSCLKLFLVQNYKINIKICDLVEKSEGDTLDQYKNKVFDIMNETYKNM